MVVDLTEEKETEDKSPIAISSFKISFGDLSNLESLINEVDEKIAKKGLNVEHFAEMKKIIKKVKNSAK